MSITPGTLGRPGVSTAQVIGFRFVSVDGQCSYKPGGGKLLGTKNRDVGNTDEPNVLRPGLLMAQHPTNKDYAPFVVGVTQAAILGADTSLTLTAAQAAELVRRVGATGTFVLTGPTKAGGTVVQRTVTYSAVNTTTGVVTITALTAVNQVDRIRFNIASTGGNIQLTVQKTDGTTATTANAAWNATDATYLAAIQTQLDTTTGVTNGIVVSAAAGIDTDIELVLTYSGTGYTGKTWTPAVVAVFPTSSTLAYYSSLQTGGGSFIAGSIVSEANYTTPKTLIADAGPVRIPLVGSTGQDTDWNRVPMELFVDTTKLIDYPSDASLKTWVKSYLSSTGGNKMTFNDEV